MKSISKITLIAMVMLTVTSCVEGNKKQSVGIETPEAVKKEKKETADIADAAFEDGMVGKVFQNYLQIRTALIHSDTKGVKKAAGNLAESFTAERAELKQIARQMAKADDLNTQRQLFSEFTTHIEPLLKASISSGTVYKQHCPMAFDNQGAYWFSEVEEIKNPYFGEKMLKCGSVEERITKN